MGRGAQTKKERNKGSQARKVGNHLLDLEQYVVFSMLIKVHHGELTLFTLRQSYLMSL